jgi:N6-adenosine-specific RNA methylase IME4
MVEGKFKTILADPPWHYNTWDKKSSLPQRKKIGQGIAADHYPTMKTKAICELPVGDLADKDCCLFMWATWPNLEAAFEVGEAWGFRYVTCAFNWTKLTPNSLSYESIIKRLKNWPSLFIEPRKVISLFPQYHFGLGYWSRANTEPCLLFTKGHPKRVNNDVAQLIVAPVGRHSAKPLETYSRIERLVEGPYLELFARNKRANWSSWGNEIESDIDLKVEGVA